MFLLIILLYVQMCKKNYTGDNLNILYSKYNLNTYSGNDERYNNTEINRISKTELDKLLIINKNKILLNILENDKINLIYKLSVIDDLYENNTIKPFSINLQHDF
jgi:hypothetical protein